MGVSKPPSDIAASSETETHSKANSDIVVGSNTIKTVGDLNRNKFDDKSKPDLVKTLNDNFKLDHVDTGRKAPIPIEVSVVIEKKSVPAENLPIPEEVKTVEAKTIKRGKLVRSSSSFSDNKVSYSFISRNSYEKTNQDDEIIKLDKIKSVDCLNNCCDDKARKKLIKIDKSCRDKRKNLVKISNVELDSVENENDKICPVYSNRVSDRWIKNNSRSFSSYDSNQRERGVVVRSKDQSRDVSDLKLEDPEIKSRNYYFLKASRMRKSNSVSEYDVFKNNSSSRPGNLEIFAVSKKPVDIKKPPVGSHAGAEDVKNAEDVIIPSEIKYIPSFPLYNKSNVNICIDNKLSILKPPPPGLVSRQESNENWNNFINRLNLILDSNFEEFFV